MAPYRELPPPPCLTPYLACVWMRDTDRNDLRARVVPDGCIDIVWIGAARLVVAGPATAPVFVDLPSNDSIVGIRFRPGLAPCLLGVDASELLDREVALEDVWGPDARRLLAAAGPGAAARRLDLLQGALAARLTRARPADELVRAAIARLSDEPFPPVRALGRALGISDRHLLRRFRVSVGYGPKTLDRVLRFQRALGLLRRSAGRPGLAGIAGAAGYAGQAHMTREFRRLAGAPPARLPLRS